jgi:hypothetical protein
LNESLLIAFIANLTLIFLIFSPVETFHCSPGNWLFSYLAVGILLLCNYFVSKHFTNASPQKQDCSMLCLMNCLLKSLKEIDRFESVGFYQKCGVGFAA